MPARGGNAFGCGRSRNPDASAPPIAALDANGVSLTPDSHATPEHRRSGLEHKAVRGIPWTFFSYTGTRILGVAATLVLARFLVPNDFGLVAFATLLIQLVVNFTNLGLGPAMVIRPDLDRHGLGTVQTSMLVLGPVSAGVVLGLSPLAADVLGDQTLVGVLAVLTIPVAFGGVTNFYAALLQRELAFPSLSACLMAQAAVSAVVSVVLAYLGAGVWSIAVGQVVGAGVYTAAVVTRSPFLVRPRFQPDVARDHVRRGIGFVLQAGFSFLEQNMDYAIVGSLNGARPLGAYSLAYRLSELPSNVIVEPVAQVTFPGFARMRHRSEDFSQTFLTVLRAVAVVGCPAALILAAAADPFVRTLLGEEWLLMIGPLSVLGIWGALRIVQATIGWMLNSVGLALKLGRAYAVLVAVTAPLLVLAAARGGLTEVSLVILGNVVVTLAIALYLAVRIVGISKARIWVTLRPVVFAAAPTWLVTRVVAEGVDLPAAPALVLSAACGALAYLVVLLLADRDVLKDLVGQLGQMWSSLLPWRASAGQDPR
jgi:O-antigen/teichoic acid export membrane protein